MGLLKNISMSRGRPGRQNADPVELQSFYYDRVYIVKFDVTKRFDNTVVIPPGNEAWPIEEMNVLSKAQSKAFLEKYELVDLKM